MPVQHPSGITCMANLPPNSVLVSCSDALALERFDPIPTSTDVWSLETHQAFPAWFKSLCVSMLITLGDDLAPRMLEHLLMAVSASRDMQLDVLIVGLCRCSKSEVVI